GSHPRALSAPSAQIRRPRDLRHCRAPSVGLPDLSIATKQHARGTALGSSGLFCAQRRDYARPFLKPSRQLGKINCQSSARLALALEAPRISFITTTLPSPATNRPTKTGTRNGGFAPTASASTGSHCMTAAGSSSTTL